MLTLCPRILLTVIISSNSFLVESSTNKDILTSSFPVVALVFHSLVLLLYLRFQT